MCLLVLAELKFIRYNDNYSEPCKHFISKKVTLKEFFANKVLNSFSNLGEIMAEQNGKELASRIQNNIQNEAGQGTGKIFKCPVFPGAVYPGSVAR